MKKIALISVYDKTGIDTFAKGLLALGFQILSSGNTSKFLKQKGIDVQEISDFTGFPEILAGRVKTLHPKVHAGILARRKIVEDQETLKRLNIPWIDLVVVNLYPFEAEANIENIDIGGPTLLRAAAKNFESVLVVSDPKDYDRVLQTLKNGEDALGLRKELAGKVFSRMAQYETAIANYFNPLATALRYGENPHQKASFRLISDVDRFWDSPLQGKELSYNNILDADSAWGLIREFQEEPFACVIVKHTNPCGVALSKESLCDAFEKALQCDTTSAFGGIVAFNKEVDEKTADALSKIFFEIILAPGFSLRAREILSTKKNLRLLVSRFSKSPQQQIRSAGGGELIQETDNSMEDLMKCQVATKRKPSASELKALQFAWKVAKHVKSNAIVLSDEEKTLGIGAGQTSRIDSVKIAITKMNQFFGLNTSTLKHSYTVAVASDAFFPFPDNIEALAKAGVTAVVQPGGSIKDPEVIAAAETHDLSMVFTGVRHFRH